MPTETMVGVEALLGQERWVRRLARALIHDGDDAEDIVQQARVTSWRRPPRDPDRVRSWLGTVVRNLVKNRKRAEEIRQRIEGELDAEADAVPSAERLAERLEIHRELAEAVSRLAEPFREVVLLRYYEDLSSAEIARRLGEPPGTIRWRLKTGLERLRAALDERRNGDRTAWLAALVPLAQKEDRPPVAARSPGAPSRATGRPGIAWIATVATTVGVAGLVGVVFGGRNPRSADLAPGPSAARFDSHARRGVMNLSVASLSAAGADPGGPASEVPGWIQLEGLPPRTIAGRVTSNGRPIAGARLRLSSGTLTSARELDRYAVSGSDGRLVFAAQPITDWILTAWAPGLAPLIHYIDLRQANWGSLVAGRAVDALEIDLAPCRASVRGTVRDPGGGVIASARVGFASGWTEGGTAARTDGDGRYELCLPDASAQARVLTAEASGYGSTEARSPAESGTVDFVLEPHGIVAGRAVRGASGEPAANVALMLLPLPLAAGATPGRSPDERRAPARRESKTDEAGRFEVAGLAPGRYSLRFASDEVYGIADKELTIAAGDQVRGLEVELSPVALVEGVASRSGTPAARVDLRFTPVPRTADNPGPRRTRSDERGRFRVRVPQDMPLTIEASADRDRPNGGWRPVLAPATFLAGKSHRDAIAIELPPAQTTTTVAGDFVTPPGAVAPPPEHAAEARFGDLIRLLGYDVARDHVARGAELEVTLHFQVLAAPEGCRLFSHLVGPSGFTNLDHGTVGGAYPVARWRMGETIRDRFSIPIPATFSPGTYTVLVGFWRPAGNRRLAVSPAARDDGESRVRVLTFTVD
jgi:RNA polymerase sigma-70 factor (ECF subfamily)